MPDFHWAREWIHNKTKFLLVFVLFSLLCSKGVGYIRRFNVFTKSLRRLMDLLQIRIQTQVTHLG